MAGFDTTFPDGVNALFQQGFIARELFEGLDSILAYRRVALQQEINTRIGQTLTLTRKGRFLPTTSPLNPSTNTSLDNGMTPTTFSVEQYTFNMNLYAQTADVSYFDDLLTIADEVIATSRNNGVAAAQSLERIARQRLFSAYLGGNSFVTSTNGAPTTTTCYLNDIRGFQTVLVNGTPTPVSSANPITVYETATSSSGVNQTLVVTAVVADATNISTTPDGISGSIVFNTASSAPVAGDALVAQNAPQIMRASGRATTQLLTVGDTFTMSLVEDAVAYLRNNAVPPFSDGNYICLLDNTSMRQLWADQDFKVLFAGRDTSPEYKNADIIKILGVTFIPTTEAYVQTTGANVTVRRPIITGAESIIQGNFQGIDEWMNRQSVSPIGKAMVVNNVAQIARPPLDRLQSILSMSWAWIGDFAVPTDITATNSIIPTASNALYKRAVAIEHAG